MSGMQLVEQRLSLLQIERVETFGEPAIDRSEKSAGLLSLDKEERQRGSASSI